MKKTLAIYPGSFNPFTVGHQNILEKTERLFDEVIVAIGINPDKIDKSTLEIIKDYSQDEKDEVIDRIKTARVNSLNNRLPSKKVEGYIGFLTDYVRQKKEEGYDEVVVIRGLRNGYDYDYEYNQTRHMWDQMPGLNIIMISCDPIFSHISSSSYRSLEKVRKGSAHHMLAIDRPNPTIELDTSNVTLEMVESTECVVVIGDDNSPEINVKYKISKFADGVDYKFKGTYSECLSWVKEKELKSNNRKQ